VIHKVTALHCYVIVPQGKHMGFWDGISCSPNDWYQCFIWMCCLSLEGG